MNHLISHQKPVSSYATTLPFRMRSDNFSPRARFLLVYLYTGSVPAKVKSNENRGTRKGECWILIEVNNQFSFAIHILLSWQKKGTTKTNEKRANAESSSLLSSFTQSKRTNHRRKRSRQSKKDKSSRSRPRASKKILKNSQSGDTSSLSLSTFPLTPDDWIHGNRDRYTGPQRWKLRESLENDSEEYSRSHDR